MSDKQFLALIQYRTTQRITELEYQEYKEILRIKFFDGGGNFHYVGIQANGSLITYQT